MISAAEKQAAGAALHHDLAYFGEKILQIKTKSGGETVPFLLNTAQRFLHNELEQQRQLTGMVRALVLKGRQQGCSTYIQGRFYHKTSMNNGVQAFILTHEQQATNNLFGMAQLFYEKSPSFLRPSLTASNAKELIFGDLHSGYSVATAGTREAGRSATAQLLHGSEVAFWPNAPKHMLGIGQIVAALPDTEIILESTANGPGNVFHQMWQMAEAGRSSYKAIFIPWYWQSEYALPVPKGWAFTEEERKYQDAYKLTETQLYWRRVKIDTDFRGDELAFQQEYPSCAAEAFVQVGHEPYITADLVLRARKREVDAIGPRVLGVDPARFGADRTALVLRQGRKVPWVKAREGIDTMETADLVAHYIANGYCDRVFVDEVGIGAGVVDRLHQMGYTEIVTGVAGSIKPTEPEHYFNKRAEMWGEMASWFKGEVQIPDSDELQADLTAPKHRYKEGNRLFIEQKSELVKRQVRSPDLADGLALTFAFPVSGVLGQVGGTAPRRVRHMNRDWRTR